MIFILVTIGGILPFTVFINLRITEYESSKCFLHYNMTMFLPHALMVFQPIYMPCTV